MAEPALAAAVAGLIPRSLSLMCVMAEKGLLNREPQGRAYVYDIRATRQTTLSRMVAHLLERTRPSNGELAEIRRTITAYRKRKGAK